METTNTALEEFLERLTLASDLAITHLAKFRSLPPASSGLEIDAYRQLFAKALSDAHAALEQMPDSENLYALLDRATAVLNSRIDDSPLLADALQPSGAFAAEGSLRAFVLASVIRATTPAALSEFAAAVLKLPAQSALSLEPLIEAPDLS